VPYGTAQVLGGNAHEGRLATTPVRGEMRRRKAKMALVRCNVKYYGSGYLSVILLKKLAKMLLLLCNTINLVEFIIT
jgi:hypothetical protein